LLASIRPYIGINSLLVQTLGNNQLDWRSVEQVSLAVQPQEARP
jgi:hypothetical protein